MQFARELDRGMASAGAISGLAGVAAYFGAAFLPAVLPIPDGVVLALAFAVGPLLGLSFFGLFHALSAGNDGPALRFGVVLGILAGATVTIMLVVQGATTSSWISSWQRPTPSCSRGPSGSCTGP